MWFICAWKQLPPWTCMTILLTKTTTQVQGEVGSLYSMAWPNSQPLNHLSTASDLSIMCQDWCRGVELHKNYFYFNFQSCISLIYCHVAALPGLRQKTNETWSHCAWAMLKPNQATWHPCAENCVKLASQRKHCQRGVNRSIAHQRK